MTSAMQDEGLLEVYERNTAQNARWHSRWLYSLQIRPLWSIWGLEICQKHHKFGLSGSAERIPSTQNVEPNFAFGSGISLNLNLNAASGSGSVQILTDFRTGPSHH
jgi:hypothetical protein